MRHSAVIIIAMLGFPIATSAGEAPKELLGSWKLASYRLNYVNENTSKDYYGENPRGFYLFTENRLMVLLTPRDRKFPESESEAAKMLKNLTAYSANYTSDDKKFVFTPDVSHNEYYVGKEQVRYYKIDGDKLTITTDVMRTANEPDRPIVGEIQFVREK
ncbi:lipocalin-like domain-containing protein [Xanthobacter oligotrophicus]|uniref:Lipocalin-like domain-containing protein n=1 Tax=Xanthobacter oligotrophicus TaxID=2607286 RepID=A0ABW7A0M4_9HYPH